MVRGWTGMRDRATLQSAVAIDHAEEKKTQGKGFAKMVWRDAAGGRGQCWLAQTAGRSVIGAKITDFTHPDVKLPAMWQGDVGRRG